MLKKNQKRKKKSTKYKEINKILEDDWVTGVSHSLLVYPLSPTSSLIQSLEPGSVLGGLHTVVDATEVPGPTPTPQLLGVRSSLLQQHSPQGPWVPCAWLLCGGGRSTTSKQRLPAVPTFADCWTRKTMQAALPLLCQERGRGGWRQAQEGRAAQGRTQEQYHRCCNTVVTSMPNHFGIIQLSINILLITCLQCSNRTDKQTLG